MLMMLLWLKYCRHMHPVLWHGTSKLSVHAQHEVQNVQKQSSYLKLCLEYKNASDVMNSNFANAVRGSRLPAVSTHFLAAG